MKFKILLCKIIEKDKASTARPLRLRRVPTYLLPRSVQSPPVADPFHCSFDTHLNSSVTFLRDRLPVIGRKRSTEGIGRL